jgi:UDP-2,3-diacylglucosamine pyrophosphatase LpxH
MHRSEPLLITSDVHLSRRSPPELARDLGRLIANHPGHEVVLAGDVFDLSAEPAHSDPLVSLLDLLRPNAELVGALRSHLSSGHPLTLVAGNHDAPAALPGMRAALLDLLGVAATAPLAITPWFVRRGKVHIEHGHLYDPDNAPTHPLAPWSPQTEPLGIALTRRFVAPNAMFAFAHAHETTPLAGFVRTVRLHGLRAPLLVARYFATAIRLCTEAGRQPGIAGERLEGARSIAAFAAQAGLEPDLLHELSVARPEPTHHDQLETFMRLYFDRIVATLALGSASAAALAGSVAGAGLAAVSAAYLGFSLARGIDRYSALPEQRLRDAAKNIAATTDADLVVFGHTHREDTRPRYLNLGSFAYSARGARPYLMVDEYGRPTRRELALACGGV